MLHEAVADHDLGADPTGVADAARKHPLASGDDVRRVVGEVLDRVSGLGALQPLLDDPEVSERSW